MDILTLIGLIVGFGAIIGGNILEGGHTGSLLLPTAFLIVVGGTVGAIMVQSPLPVFLHAMKSFMKIFLPPKIAAAEAIQKILGWSGVARKD